MSILLNIVNICIYSVYWST